MQVLGAESSGEPGEVERRQISRHQIQPGPGDFRANGISTAFDFFFLFYFNFLIFIISGLTCNKYARY